VLSGRVRVILLGVFNGFPVRRKREWTRGRRTRGDDYHAAMPARAREIFPRTSLCSDGLTRLLDAEEGRL